MTLRKLFVPYEHYTGMCAPPAADTLSDCAFGQSVIMAIAMRSDSYIPAARVCFGGLGSAQATRTDSDGRMKRHPTLTRKALISDLDPRLAMPANLESRSRKPSL